MRVVFSVLLIVAVCLGVLQATPSWACGCAEAEPMPPQNAWFGMDADQLIRAGLKYWVLIVGIGTVTLFLTVSAFNARRIAKIYHSRS